MTSSAYLPPDHPNLGLHRQSEKNRASWANWCIESRPEPQIVITTPTMIEAPALLFMINNGILYPPSLYQLHVGSQSIMTLYIFAWAFSQSRCRTKLV